MADDTLRDSHQEPLKAEFPDQSNFNRVRDALWKRPSGASIMIGSGFSRNAEMVQSTPSPAPSWRELIEAMCEKLYPYENDGHQVAAITAAGETSGALRLAQEFETAFGRSGLFSFLRTHVRDDLMEPRQFHRRLLRLPWRDVFTTNWDTLLERTLPDLLERPYTIVHNAGEIPLVAPPRIIKLHGSLNDHIIITEEDYRTYPGEFAPFVNTVRQSMMESVFCLIGFSGDDPNFLHWSGWVRDNLKDMAPKIYLAGWLDLSDHRRTMLKSRNVVPIDLARHPLAKKWPEARRHEYATEWILHSLEAGRPYDADRWPDLEMNSSPAPPDHLEPVQKVLGNRPRQTPDRSSDRETESVAQEFVEVWSHNREKTYPGWLTAPYGVRQQLWSTIENANDLVQMLPVLAPALRLNTIREILWLYRIHLMPLSSVEPASAKLKQEAQTVLECIDCAAQTVEGQHLHDMDWPRLREAWIEVGFELVRAARLCFDKEEFDSCLETVRPFREESHEIRHRFLHEQCLWAIFSLDYATLDNLLKGWDVEAADPVWMMRKSALLFELGKNENAAALNAKALERASQKRGRDEDIGLLSREAWAQVCAGTTLDYNEFHYAWGERRRRWEELTPVKCNIPMELRKYAEGIRESREEGHVRPFDFGHVWLGGFSLSNAEYHRWVAAHRTIRLSEVVGLPPRAGNTTAAADLFEAAARHLVWHELNLSIWLVLRAAKGHSNSLLNVVLSRANIANLSRDYVDQIVRTCFGAIDYIIPLLRGVPTENHWPERLKVFIEAVSRFVLRLEPDEAGKIFDRAIKWYGDDLISRSMFPETPMRNLLSRSWEALSTEQRREKVVDMLGAPLVGLDGFAASAGPHTWYVDPGEVLEGHPISDVVRSSETEDRWRDIAGLLFRGLRAGGEARKRAALRMVHFVKLGIPTEPERMAMAQALWEDNGRMTAELPQGTKLFDRTFITLPEPDSGMAEQRFRRKWLEPSAPEGTNAEPPHRILQEVGDAIRSLRDPEKRLSLSEKERDFLAGVVVRWIAEPIPGSFHSNAGGISSAFFGQEERVFRGTIAGLCHVLLQIKMSIEHADALFEKVNNLNETKVPVRVLSASLIGIRPGRSEEVVQSLRTALASDDVTTAKDAVNALRFWLDARGGG
ncbi:MAG: SIR2 family protein, partial [Rhodobacteraceae bacterium]|nr:SIR2 family protein [Paracoccaceae bacterium]